MEQLLLLAMISTQFWVKLCHLCATTQSFWSFLDNSTKDGSQALLCELHQQTVLLLCVILVILAFLCLTFIIEL